MTYRWVPQGSEGQQWKMYSGTILLGVIQRVAHTWVCANFRFRKGVQSGHFSTLTDAAKWMHGYDMRPIKGWQKRNE